MYRLRLAAVIAVTVVAGLGRVGWAQEARRDPAPAPAPAPVMTKAPVLVQAMAPEYPPAALAAGKQAEVAVRAVLISNNDQLIFTNAATDPFTAPGDATTTNSNHSAYLTTSIGFANFDYAHVIHTGGDFGNAGAIGTACSPTDKGLGMSSANPVPIDNLAVKLVCHEMGHQFGANHSYNSCFGGQSGPQQYALEPGSGSTNGWAVINISGTDYYIPVWT